MSSFLRTFSEGIGMNIGIKSVKLASSYHPRYFTIYTVFHFNKILSFLLLKSMPSPKSIESLLSTDSWLGDVNSYQIIFDFIYIFMLVKNNCIISIGIFMLWSLIKCVEYLFLTFSVPIQDEEKKLS